MKHALSLPVLSTALGAALLVAGFATTTDAEAASRRVVRSNVTGGTAARAGTNTRNADGSATHQSGLSASGSRGSVQSSGSASRDAAGNVTQSRSTSATSAATGNSVQSSSSYTKDTGLTRSATCYNASGAVIACR